MQPLLQVRERSQEQVHIRSREPEHTQVQERAQEREWESERMQAREPAWGSVRMQEPERGWGSVRTQAQERGQGPEPVRAHNRCSSKSHLLQGVCRIDHKILPWCVPPWVIDKCIWSIKRKSLFNLVILYHTAH